MMNRRSYPRVEVARPVHYYTDIYPTSHLAFTIDLSMGGIGIDSMYDLTMGEKLEISLFIPPQLVRCSGIVVHVFKLVGERVKAGVRFESLSKRDSLFLGEYISFIVTTERDEAIGPAKGIIIGIGFGLLIWAAIVSSILVFI